LLRFGIECALIDDFAELDTSLGEIARRSRGRTVYATGSHLDASNEAARSLGAKVAQELDLIVIDGQSAGVSRQFVSGFTEKAAISKLDIEKRLQIFANPYANTPAFESDPSLIPVLKQWRAPLMRATQAVLVFDGTMGTATEVELAKQLGCIVIPVPTSDNGYARELIRGDTAVSSRLPADYVDLCRRSAPSPEAVIECLKKTIGLVH